MRSIKLAFVIAAGVCIGLLALLLLLGWIGQSGSWRFVTQKDAMTDRVRAQAYVTAQDGRSAMELSCRQGEEVRLVVQADQRTGGYGSDDNYVPRMVRYRVDQGPIQDVVGTLGDHFIGFDQATRGARRDAPIIAALANARTLAIETETVRKGSVQIVFDVSGAGGIIRRLRQSCEVGT